MTHFLPHIEIESGPNPTAAVIWLHGLGADGNDFAAVVPQLQLNGCPAIRFVFPHAPSIAVSCAMALHTGLRYKQKLAGIVALSGYLPLADTLAHERSQANANTPLFMAHGTQDPVVVLDRGEVSKNALSAMGYSVQWKTYAMGHSVHPQELADISKFLRDVLAA